MDNSNPQPTVSTYVAEAVLLAQEIIKNPQAVGTATSQSVKASPAGNITESITYSVAHSEMKKLANGQDDITQLPTISLSIVNKVDPPGSAPTGSMHVLLSYSGEVKEAYGTIIRDGVETRTELNPSEAFAIAKEAVAAVKASNA